MDTVIYLALVIFWTAFVSIIGFGKQKKCNSAMAYFLPGRTLNCAAALSSWLADCSLFALIVIPALSFPSVRGIKQGVLTIVAVIAGGLFSWIALSRRIRVYAEVTDSATIPEYMEKRFKSPSGVARSVSAILGIILCCAISGFALSVSITFCDALFGVGRLAGVLFCVAVVLVLVLSGGVSSVMRANILQTVLLLGALICAVVFAYLGNENAQLSIVYENLKNLSDMFPRIFGDYYHLSVWDVVVAFSVGACWLGLPHVLTYYMSGRDKRQYRRASNICLVCSACTLICSGIMGIFSYPVGSGSGPVLLQGLTLVENPYVRNCLIVIFLACMLSVCSTYLMTASTYIAYDLYPRIRRTGAADVSVVLKIVLIPLSVILALIAWDPKMSHSAILVTALECFASSFGPVFLFSLYSSRITHKGAVCCMFTGVTCVVIIRLIFFMFDSDGYMFYALVPAFLLSSMVLWGVSCLDKKKNRREVVLEFDRVNTIMKCRNQFYIKQ